MALCHERSISYAILKYAVYQEVQHTKYILEDHALLCMMYQSDVYLCGGVLHRSARMARIAEVMLLIMLPL